jgi:hypothetical protein
MRTKPYVDISIEEYTRGTLPVYKKAQAELALPLLERAMGRPMAYFNTLVGRINCVTQLWGYDSIADYQDRRFVIEATPEWRKYLAWTSGALRFVNTRLTRRVVFDGTEAGEVVSRAKPVVDFRVSHIHSNRISTFLETSQLHAFPVMIRHIGPPLGYYQSILGKLDEITHVWGFDSMGDIEARCDSRNSDPDWPDYLLASDGVCLQQQTQIMRRLALPATA